jgi:hypothetical protein
MALRAAISDGVTALRRAPGLVLAGLVVAAATGLGSLAELVELGPFAGLTGVAWALAFPYALGGFVGMAHAAIRDGDASLATFRAAGRANYARLFVATLLFLVVVVGVVMATMTVGFLTTAGAVVLAGVGDAAALDGGRLAFGFGVASMSLTLAVVLVGLFVSVLCCQFYAAAVVVEDAGVTEAFSRSATVVRANLPGAVAFTVAWLALTSTVLRAEFLLGVVLPGADPPTVGGVAVDLPLAAGLPVVLGVAAVGFAVLYAVQTAYFLRLAETVPPEGEDGNEVPSAGATTETGRPPGAVSEDT